MFRQRKQFGISDEIFNSLKSLLYPILALFDAGEEVRRNLPFLKR